MTIALLADVHGNLPALEAVLEDLDGRPEIGAVYHLGDVVGYGPWPDECVELLARREIAGVAGNYDSTVAVGHPHCGCRAETPRDEELAHASYAWTRARVSGATRTRLAALPFRLDVRPLGGHHSRPQVTLVHAAPTVNTLYWTESRGPAFATKMAAQAGLSSGDVLAFGHTHRPWSREMDGVLFVNAGSVGRPKDGDPRACYALLEITGGAPSARFVRVTYDVERVAAAIAAQGLPVDLAEQLRTAGAASAQVTR